MENKIKKMSLANIEGKLTPAEMENIMAGSGIPCGWIGIYTVLNYGVLGVFGGYLMGQATGLNEEIVRCWNS